MGRTLIRALDALLAVLCCYLLGFRIVGPVVGSFVAPTVAPGPTASAPPAMPPARGWSDRQVILGRNLFDAKILGGEPVTDEDEEYEKTKLALRLLGTAAGHGPDSWAAVEDQETRKHLVVRQGDTLQGKAEVIRIDRGRIVLRNGGRMEELAMEEPTGFASGPSPARASSPIQPRAAVVPRPGVATLPNVQRLAENRFAVPRADVESVAQDPSALFSQARILPKYENGAMVGVQLNAIKPGSLFQQIGIQDGDTITELNGIRVTGQEQSAEILRELTQAQSLSVTVTGRDGGVRQLQYQVQ
jgi:general secretion pathway protein C